VMDRKEKERLPVNNIEVTYVKVYPFDTTQAGGNVKAVATIRINDMIEIKDIKLLYFNNGYFIQMPLKRNRAGEYVPVVNLLSKELYAHIRRKVLDEYDRVINKL